MATQPSISPACASQPAAAAGLVLFAIQPDPRALPLPPSHTAGTHTCMHVGGCWQSLVCERVLQRRDRRLSLFVLLGGALPAQALLPPQRGAQQQAAPALRPRAAHTAGGSHAAHVAASCGPRRSAASHAFAAAGAALPAAELLAGRALLAPIAGLRRPPQRAAPRAAACRAAMTAHNADVHSHDCHRGCGARCVEAGCCWGGSPPIAAPWRASLRHPTAGRRLPGALPAIAASCMPPASVQGCRFRAASAAWCNRPHRWEGCRCRAALETCACDMLVHVCGSVMCTFFVLNRGFDFDSVFLLLARVRELSDHLMHRPTAAGGRK